jgi:uncharacterized protein (DUF885 family)
MSEIDQLAGDFFEFQLDHSPSWAHVLGRYERAARYEDATAGGQASFTAGLREYAARAAAVDGLEGDRQVTAQVLEAVATSTADLLDADLVELSADPIFGPQVDIPITVSLMAVPDAEVAEAMVEKYSSIAQYWHDLGQRLADGAAKGRSTPVFAVTGVIEQLDAIMASPVVDDSLVNLTAPQGVDESAWRERLALVVEKEIRPAMAAYQQVLRDQVLPIARPDEQAGLSWLEGGDDAYARTLRYYTTTDKNAQEIHDLGLEVVARLGDEYRALGPAVVGSDDLDTILEALRTDPALHFETGEQMVEMSKVALARAEAVMGDWFEVVPKAPCGVEGIDQGAKAFYFPPATDGSRGGTFFINTSDPESWGIFELESMAFHEGVPGHHLQLAIASELPDTVPDFRKHAFISAYGEGWGLYTERLADEMGLYSDDVQKMGMLSADSMRACRLVVDTGLHALGWGREQAVDYMVANSPMSRAMVQAEIDRYICTPGQATSYMIGRLEILRMRAEAQARQGAAFDIKKFHSAVLDSGNLPLAVLDRVVATRLP